MKFNNVNFIGIRSGTQKKINYKKIIALVISITIIIISVILYIKFNQKDNINSEETKDETTESAQNIDNEKKEINSIYFEQFKENVKHIYKSEEKRVFLTFDDGPSKTVTVQILDILKKNNIKATFFVLGNRVEINPDVLRREYEEGHYIANHGYSHDYAKIYEKNTNVLDEYLKTEQCIRDALENSEYSSHLFRFPGGSVGGKYAEIKKQAIGLLEDNGATYLDWNALSKDAEGNFDKDKLIQNVISTSNGKNSIVVLMHDTGAKKSTVEALQSIIDYFIERGYIFKNMYDILE